MKAIVFDMDGVLVDSEPAHFVADAKTLNLFGAGADPEEMRGFTGIDIGDFFTIMRAKYGVSASVAELIEHKNRFLIDELRRHLPRPPGMAETIAGVTPLPLRRALASSSHRVVVDTVLKGLGLADWFDTSVAGDEVARAKPDPAIFLKAAEGMGVRPADCMVIEDSHSGVKAAKAVGMRVIAFVNPNSGPQDFSLADHVIECLPDAVRIVSDLTGRRDDRRGA